MIKINDFFVDKFAVTVALWNGVCEKTGALSKRRGNPDEPVTLVNFYDAVSFINALSDIVGNPQPYKDGVRVNKGLHLPSKEEWMAAAAPEGIYIWGDEDFNNAENPYAVLYSGNCVAVQKCGSKLPNRNGLFDMCGNVCEWSDEVDGGFGVLLGGSVHLDCVYEAESFELAPRDFASLETGFRLYSDFDTEIPDELYDRTPYTGEYKNPRKDFFEYIDFSDERMREVKQLYNSGKTQEAKRAYVSFLSQNMKNIGLERMWNIQIERVDTDPDDALKLTVDNWFSDIAHDVRATPMSLLLAYLENGDERYLEKWFELSAQFCREVKDDYDNLSIETLTSNVRFPVVWYYGQGFDSGVRIQKICSSLKRLLEAKDEFSDFEIDCIWDIITYCVGHSLSWVFKDDRRLIPNQHLENAMTKLVAGAVFNTTKTGKTAFESGKKQLINAVLNSNTLPDGGDMEQAYGYNIALLSSAMELKALLGYIFPEVIKPAVMRLRYLKAAFKPCGKLPSTGTGSEYYPPSVTAAELSEIIKKLRDEWKIYDIIDDKPLLCNSVHFPYSGIFVFKNSDSITDSVYLWMMSARMGKGHLSENVNGINISAYGVPMITNAGASTYGSREFVPEDQWYMMSDFDEYQHSGYAQSSLLVDGMPQIRLRIGENNNRKPYKTPIGYRFHEGEFIDFGEGIYDDDYGDNSRTLHAMHKREILFFKKQGIFVIKDVVEAKGRHTATEMFHIVPYGAEYCEESGSTRTYRPINGYKKDEVVIENNRVYTIKPEKPNFEIAVFGNECDIHSHYGELNPARGWLGGTIRGRRSPKHDVHIKFGFADKGEQYTVIAPSKTEERIIKEASFENGILSLRTADSVITVNKEGAEVNGKKLLYKDITIPETFCWEEKDGGVYPKYF